MLSQDDGLSKLIVLDDNYEVDGVTLGSQVPTLFSLILEEMSFHTVSYQTSGYLGYVHFMDREY